MNSKVKTLSLGIASAGLAGGTLWVGTSATGPANAAPESVATTTTSAEARKTSPLNDCPAGTLPFLDIADSSEAAKTVGAATVEAAVASLLNTPASRLDLTITPLASDIDSAPRWVTAGDRTYIVNPAPDGGWIASEATFVECQKLDGALGN